MTLNSENNSSSWVVIVNPNAGTKKGKKDWKEISKLLKAQKLPAKEYFTDQKEHAITITLDSIKKGHRQFLVVGGDGTLNEVVNGIFMQKEVPTGEFLVGMIPVGTGNDWCRMFNIPFNYKKAIKLIRKRETFIQDIGRVTYFNSEDKKTRYFINVAGMGYDAVVAEKTNKDKSAGRGGPLVYIKNLFTSLLFYKHADAEIHIGNIEQAVACQAFSLSVGICKYNGGGMKQLPHAVADDGLLDMTLIRKIGKFTVLREVKNLYDGSFTKHPKVDTYKAKKFRIAAKPPIYIETDGESLGHSPFEFDILPQSLKVIVGQAEKS